MLFCFFFTPPVFHSLDTHTRSRTGSIRSSTKHPLKFPNGLNHRLTARFDFSNWTQEGGADNPLHTPRSANVRISPQRRFSPKIVILLSPFETKCFHDWRFLFFPSSLPPSSNSKDRTIPAVCQGRTPLRQMIFHIKKLSDLQEFPAKLWCTCWESSKNK